MPALSATTTFERNYQRHLQHLQLKGLRPKTIEAYARAIRRLGKRFDNDIDQLTEQQLTDHFSALLASHSWSAVKLANIRVTAALRTSLRPRFSAWFGVISRSELDHLERLAPLLGVPEVMLHLVVQPTLR